MADYKKSSVHCHSTMCDGKNTLQEMASAACAQGLTTLGFTGHSYTQRDREYCMSPSRTAQYKATIAKLKTEYKGKVDILCGIEWDLLSEDKRTGYDYWIGSAHHLYGKNTGKYYEIDFRPQDLHDCIYDDFDGDPLAAVEAYFAEVEKVAAMGPDILDAGGVEQDGRQGHHHLRRPRHRQPDLRLRRGRSRHQGRRLLQRGRADGQRLRDAGAVTPEFCSKAAVQFICAAALFSGKRPAPPQALTRQLPQRGSWHRR